MTGLIEILRWKRVFKHTTPHPSTDALDQETTTYTRTSVKALFLERWFFKHESTKKQKQRIRSVLNHWCPCTAMLFTSRFHFTHTKSYIVSQYLQVSTSSNTLPRRGPKKAVLGMSSSLQPKHHFDYIPSWTDMHTTQGMSGKSLGFSIGGRRAKMCPFSKSS